MYFLVICRLTLFFDHLLTQMNVGNLLAFAGNVPASQVFSAIPLCFNNDTRNWRHLKGSIL